MPSIAPLSGAERWTSSGLTEIVALRACWTVDEGTGRARCSSLSLAQALGAALELGADVINLSLSGPRDPLLERLIDAALAQGAIVVAAWPDDESAGGDFPASHPGVIAVGASGPTMLGPPELLRAPGREVLSTVPDADYAFFTGNSMSAAFVAGVAPQQLGPLPFTELHVRVGQVIDDVGSGSGRHVARLAADQAIAQADQVVADIDGRGHAMPPMQRLMAVTVFIIVLDVVVHERGFVKSFHRHGDSTYGIRKRDFLIVIGRD